MCVGTKGGGIDRRGRWDGMMCCGVQQFQTPNPQKKKRRGDFHMKRRDVFFFFRWEGKREFRFWVVVDLLLIVIFC